MLFVYRLGFIDDIKTLKMVKLLTLQIQIFLNLKELKNFIYIYMLYM